MFELKLHNSYITFERGQEVANPMFFFVNDGLSSHVTSKYVCGRGPIGSACQEVINTPVIAMKRQQFSSSEKTHLLINSPYNVITHSFTVLVP